MLEYLVFILKYFKKYLLPTLYLCSEIVKRLKIRINLLESMKRGYGFLLAGFFITMYGYL